MGRNSPVGIEGIALYAKHRNRGGGGCSVAGNQGRSIASPDGGRLRAQPHAVQFRRGKIGPHPDIHMRCKGHVLQHISLDH